QAHPRSECRASANRHTATNGHTRVETGGAGRSSKSEVTVDGADSGHRLGAAARECEVVVSCGTDGLRTAIVFDGAAAGDETGIIEQQGAAADFQRCTIPHV